MILAPLATLLLLLPPATLEPPAGASVAPATMSLPAAVEPDLAQAAPPDSATTAPAGPAPVAASAAPVAASPAPADTRKATAELRRRRLDMAGAILGRGLTARRIPDDHLDPLIPPIALIQGFGTIIIDVEVPR